MVSWCFRINIMFRFIDFMYLITFLSVYFLSLINGKSSKLITIFFGIIVLFADYSNTIVTTYNGNLTTSNTIMISILIINYLISLGDRLQYISIFLGLIYLQQSNNLLITLICLELININLYLLICVFSSGIKYIITSLILTTFFLFGILLSVLLLFGWPLIIVFLLKLGIFPFQKLTADLYDGLPVDIMMLIQLPIKFAIFIFLVNNGLIMINNNYLAMFIIIPAISTQYAMTFKRFLALSSTSYQTLLFLLLGSSSTAAISNYAIIYFITLNALMMILDLPI